LYGNPATALKDPYSIVLTRSTAQSLFGTDNVVGKTIHYVGDRNSQPNMDMTVTAIMEDIPNNSSISFNAVGSYTTLYAVKPSGIDIDEDWGNWMSSTFISFNQNDANVFTDKVNKLWLEQEKMLGNSPSKIRLIPLDEVHFHNNSIKQLIFILQLIGVFILIIAIINFINLAISKSATRSREIGIRQVIGSHRIELIKQFLSESILISFIAAPVAILIVELSKPFYFRMIGKQIPFDFIYQPYSVLIFIACVIIIGTISGIYPAIVLSAFKPVAVLKGEITKGKRGNSIRHALIVFQFAISIALIICTIIVSKQVNYLKYQDLGFNDKNIIHFNQSKVINKHFDVFKQKLLQNPDILNVARSNVALGRDLPIGLSTEINGVKKSFRATTVDPDFIPTMKIKITEGRPFSWDIKSDKMTTMIVNEAFVKEFMLKPALGAELDLNGKARIIGVMKDFHYTSFHQKVEPAALFWVDWNSEINIHMTNKNVSKTIQYVKNTWDELSPETPFEFEFLDKTYDQLYKSDERFQSIINGFSILAIILACMGLFGLISQNTNRRIKEIGVRKILGASINSIVFTLTNDLLKWVVIANIIAWPLAWFIMNRWLQNFAYHTEMSWWMFVLSGGIALIIALATISLQAIKAATANPVDSLNNE
jgi:putative ABC transport system permease protein